MTRNTDPVARVEQRESRDERDEGPGFRYAQSGLLAVPRTNRAPDFATCCVLMVSQPVARIEPGDTDYRRRGMYSAKSGTT